MPTAPVRFPLVANADQRDLRSAESGVSQVFVPGALMLNAFADQQANSEAYTIYKRPGVKAWGAMGVTNPDYQGINVRRKLDGTEEVTIVQNGIMSVGHTANEYVGGLAEVTAPWVASTGGFGTHTQVLRRSTTNYVVVSNRGGLTEVYTSAGSSLDNLVLKTDNPGWVARDGFRCITAGSYIYLMGGRNAAGARLNDCWRSADGITWTQQTAAAAWAVREQFGVAVVGSTMYLMGGYDGTTYYNDVYSSTDGATWTLITAAAPWAARYNFGCTTVSGAIYITCGVTSGAVNARDVWRLDPANTWVLVNNNLHLGMVDRPIIRSLQVATIKGVANQLLGIASDGSVTINSLVTSSDGFRWERLANTTLQQSHVPQGGFIWNSSLAYDMFVYPILGSAPFSSPVYLRSGGMSPTTHHPADLVFTADPVDSEGMTNPLVHFINFPLVAPELPPTDVTYPQVEGFFAKTATEGLVYNAKLKCSYSLNYKAGFSRRPDSAYPSYTVGKPAYLGGRVYVMTPEGRIYASGISDPFSWSALGFITAESRPDRGIGLAQLGNIVIAFGRDSIEFMYDSGEATNPLRRHEGASVSMGALCGDAVETIGNSVYFIGASAEVSGGVGVYRLTGFTPTKVSTGAVDRWLQGTRSSLTWSTKMSIAGHTFYILNNDSDSWSWVYDVNTGLWSKWVEHDGDTWTVASASSASNTATGAIIATLRVTATSWAPEAGNIVYVTGVSQDIYNGSFKLLSATEVAYPTYDITYQLNTLTAPAGTPTVTSASVYYTSQYELRQFVRFAAQSDLTEGTSGLNQVAYVLQKRVSNIFVASPEEKYDATGRPVGMMIRTPRSDLGYGGLKTVHRAELLGDMVPAYGDADFTYTHTPAGTKPTSQMWVAYSDDDYQTWSADRGVIMNTKKPRLTGQGSTVRRAYRIWNNEPRTVTLEGMELLVSQSET